MTKQAFYDKYYPYAAAATKGTGIFPLVALSQAALESAWGTSKSATQGNNFHGIKAFRGEPSFTMPTKERVNGETITVMGKFIKYSSPLASFQGHVKFLQENKRYTIHGVFTAKTEANQARAIAQAGYASDENYATHVVALINEFRGFGPAPVTMLSIPVLGPVIIALSTFFKYGLPHFHF